MSKKAIERLYQLKGRDKKKPLSFLCPDLSDVAKYAHVSNFAYRTMKGLTPGAFTFILEATRLVPEIDDVEAEAGGHPRAGCAVGARPWRRCWAGPSSPPRRATREGEPLIDAKDIKESSDTDWI